MVNFSKLSELFIAQQRLEAYNTSKSKRTEEQKELADITGNGVIDSTDKALINEKIRDLKKDLTLYDVDSDGDVDFDDLNALNGDFDLDNDGTISDAEKKFISSQKAEMDKQIHQKLKKDKFTGVAGDGKYYNKGVISTGIFEDKYYIKGDKATGTQVYKNILFIEGDRARETQVFNNVLYVNGEKAKGLNVFENVLYKDGKKSTTTQVFEGILYKKGEKATGTEVFKNTLYVEGEKATETQVFNNVLYVEGEKAKGMMVFEDILYKDGKKSTTTQVFEGILYKKGEKAKGTEVFKNILYVEGEKATETQVFKNTLYVNGEKAKGMMVFEDILYKDGKKATGTQVFEDKLYKKGEKATGTEVYKNKLYVDGEPACETQVYKNVLYVNGEKAKGMMVFEDILYKDGKKATGTLVFEDKLYKKGEKATGTEVYKNKLYVDGEPARETQVFKNTLYVNGEKAKGMMVFEDILYKDGKKATGTQVFEDCLYKKGAKVIGTEVYQKVLYIDGEKASGTHLFNKVLYVDGEVANDVEAFDTNGNNKIDVEDINDLFQYESTGIDLDNDGTITDEEKKFVQDKIESMRKSIEKDLKADKYTGLVGGVYYKDGKVSSGTFEDVMYDSKGKPLTGKGKDGKYYKEGVLANGQITVKETRTQWNSKTRKYENVVVKVTYMCVNGEKLTGVCEEDGKYYKNGKVSAGVVTNDEGKEIRYNNKGEKLTGEYKGLYYEEGELFSGLRGACSEKEVDRYYEAGKPLEGEHEITDEDGNKDTFFFKKGVKFTGYDSKTKKHYVDGKEV